MLSLISHACSIYKIELLAWGRGQRELLMLPLHHQLCWAPAGAEDLGERRGGPIACDAQGPPSFICWLRAGCPPSSGRVGHPRHHWLLGFFQHSCHTRSLSVHLARGRSLSEWMRIIAIWVNPIFKVTWTIWHLLPLGVFCFQPQIPGEPKLFPYPILGQHENTEMQLEQGSNSLKNRISFEQHGPGKPTAAALSDACIMSQKPLQRSPLFSKQNR